MKYQCTNCGIEHVKEMMLCVQKGKSKGTPMYWWYCIKCYNLLELG